MHHTYKLLCPFDLSLFIHDLDLNTGGGGKDEEDGESRKSLEVAHNTSTESAGSAVMQVKGCRIQIILSDLYYIITQNPDPHF